MFASNTSEIKMTMKMILWNMKEGSIGDCGNDSTEDVVLIKEDFTMGKINILFGNSLFFKKTFN